MQFIGERIILGPARGKTEAAKRYEFIVGEQHQEVLLTTGLDVTFLFVRPFTGTSLLALYASGNPVEPQFVVAEFDYDDTHISHVLDHGSEIGSAIGDWKTRRPGDTTATAPADEPQTA